MGCDTYELVVNTLDGLKAVKIRFSEMDDTVACLCTFPQNDLAYGAIDTSTAKSLAMLGATIKLIFEGYIKDDWIYLPNSLPKDVLKLIEEGFSDLELGDNK